MSGRTRVQRTSERFSRRLRVAGLTILLVAVALPALARPVTLRPQYRIDATVSVDPARVDGSAEIVFTNHSDKTLREVVLFTFPNRFATPDADVNDLSRPFIYPEQEFDPGAQEILEVLDGGRSAATEVVADAAIPGTARRAAIAPLAPGETRRLRVRFRTEVPHRFGTFGEFEKQLTLVGGWYPYLAELYANGEWGVAAPPPLADFTVTLTPLSPLQMVVNGHSSEAGEVLHARVPAVAYLSLVAAPRLDRFGTASNGTQILLLRRPEHLVQRLVPGPDRTEQLLAAVAEMVARFPESMGAPPPLLVVAEAPLRLHLTDQGEGMVLVSDRVFGVFGPLRKFHEAHVAATVFAELIRTRVAARESADDYGWVLEATSSALAKRYMDSVAPRRRLLRDWLRMFDFLAVVDRFDKAPKIPFISTYFERVPDVDPQRQRVPTFNRERPSGKLVLDKLRDLVGDAAYEHLLDLCLGSREPLRECAEAAVPGRGVAQLVEDWTGPYPILNYWVEDVDFNAREADHFRTTAVLRRESSRDIAEPVTVRLRTVGGADVDVKWNSAGERAILSETTDRRVYRVHIDPDRKLIETRRDDNAWLPKPQVVLDSADIEVSSTEFGFAAQLVGRIDQDYHKDVALAGYYTSRGLGFALGPRLHFGELIDPTTHRHNLHAFYSFTRLNSSFSHEIRRGIETKGNLAGFGVRYDYSNVFYSHNPTLQRSLRLYADWYDKALGSDFNYVAWGYNAAATYPLFSPRTILAGQLINGFSEALGGSTVPNQGAYSLGGARSIRGVGFGEELARNIFVVRAELRHTIYPELDWNLLDIVTLRRTQLRAFTDTGGVSNSAGRIYDPRHWAVGVGVGIGLVYEALGFFPAVAYVEVATQVDRPSQLGDIQVLFGTRQAF
jgi:hypothetical protein